jgi:hypothetical protein
MEQDITLASGDTFTALDSALLALLIYRRCDRNMLTATRAWQRLMQNDASIHDFRRLVRRAERSFPAFIEVVESE